MVKYHSTGKKGQKKVNKGKMYQFIPILGPKTPLLPIFSRHEFLIKGKNYKNNFNLWKSINVQAKNQKKLSLRG